MAPGDLSREQLIDLVAQIMRAEGRTEAEDDRLVDLFDSSVVHPEATDLIFYPHKHFGHDDPSPEEVVDAALAYRPIELGPGG